MNWSLLMIPGVALGRAIFGWLENALQDKEISLPEWQQLGSTILRMGVPMVAMVWGLNIDVGISAGLVTVADVIISKVYSMVMKGKKK